MAWYDRRDEHFERAYAGIAAVRALREDAPQWAELRSFDRWSAAQLVFESNRIEGAGLSEGETRKVVDKFFPALPATYVEFRRGGKGLDSVLDQDVNRRVIEGVVAARTAAVQITPSVRLGRLTRGLAEVRRHYIGLRAIELLRHSVILRSEACIARLDAEAETGHWILEPDSGQYRDVLARIAPWFGRWLADPGAVTDDEAARVLTTADVRELHANLAEDLLPKDAGVPAGEWRIDDRAVGLDVKFPAPELIPAAMERWSVRASQLLREAPDDLSTAAAISYDFVRIHPFPDFNGRVSRLLLNLALRTAGVPFWSSIQGHKEGRKRYLQALARANRGNMRWYETLVAEAVCRGFDQIDENLRAAGLPTLR